MSVQTKSLKGRHSELSESYFQLEVISSVAQNGHSHLQFSHKLSEIGLWPLRPLQLEIFQINVGKMCNQVCKHCHVDAGPDRKEIMNRDTMELCLEAIRHSGAHTVDLTGGAPEMNPDFKWFVSEIFKTSVSKIIVRCNLTIILANKKYHDLPQFFKDHKIEVVSSLPFYNASRTDAQRGDGVFEKSIEALKLLNQVGYGKENSGLILNLVYNPSGAFLPAAQSTLEQEYKKRLKQQFDIDFNALFTITNLPISRFLEYLLESGNYESYMNKLIDSFNPDAASKVMCRNTISIGWDGYIYDCDFNQMLDLKIAHSFQHLKDWKDQGIQERDIVINQHCYGCTAGAGSSCGGSTA